MPRKTEKPLSSVLTENLFMQICAGIVLIIIIVALLTGRSVTDTRMAPQMISLSGSNALELNVINVDSIIARQFNLTTVSGVLVNYVPQGTARRFAGIKRGDVILKYNNINVQDAAHLGHLMSQNKAGDTVTFLIARNGILATKTFTIPQTAGITDFFTPSVIDISIVIIILIATFSALFFNLLNRTVCVVLGAAAMMIVGSLLGFYSQTKAFKAIIMNPILIFIGISIFSIFLEKLQFFDYVAKKMIIKIGTDTKKIIFALCFLTYLFSLFVNNLTTILVMIPITLSLCRSLKIDPVPVVIAEVISSNIGGASTMIGDFPNMLISASTGLLFFDFLTFMAPFCFILLLSLYWYMDKFEFKSRKPIQSSVSQKAFMEVLKKEVNAMKIDWPSVKKVILILGFVILGFMFLPIFEVKAATIALTGGFVLLAIENKHAKDILKKISFTDVIFFMALFIIVGGALHSGLLETLSHTIINLSMGHQLLYLIILMWIVAFFTAFLNAGPSTAFFIPIVMHSQFAAFSDLVWWALSLGVLAGSSATITGATAGIVTQTILEENYAIGVNDTKTQLLTYGNYSKRGIPVAVMFLVLSSLYMAFLCSIPLIP